VLHLHSNLTESQASLTGFNTVYWQVCSDLLFWTVLYIAALDKQRTMAMHGTGCQQNSSWCVPRQSSSVPWKRSCSRLLAVSGNALLNWTVDSVTRHRSSCRKRTESTVDYDCDYDADDLLDGHRQKILLHVFAAESECRIELIHRSCAEVGSMAPGGQQQVERTLNVVVAELQRHGEIGRARPLAMSCTRWHKTANVCRSRN